MQKDLPSEPSRREVVSTLYTVEEVADMLRVDAATVRRWVAKGLIEVVELPHEGKRTVVRISQRVLDQLLVEKKLFS